MRPDAPSAAEAGNVGGEAVFQRILVGIDETPESLIAAAQAGVLRAPGGELVLLAVVERHLAAHAGVAMADVERQLVDGTAADLDRARELVDADDAILAFGRFGDVFCGEGAKRGATLLAVGVRPHRRLGALTFGGHDVDALHDASRSVLIARPGWGPHNPDRVVVGVDGSAESRTAENVARALAGRLGADLVPVVGLEGGVDLGLLRAERTDALLDPRPLADAVVGASTRSSLIVIGRRGERRRRWGGNLVERVVYGARSSVLVVHGENAAA
jgi:nucleotide-binding universal stress UspA family protein